MIYLVGQIGLILAVAALLFFGLGYWYGRNKAVMQERPMVFEEGSVTAAAVSVMEEKIQQKDRQISTIQEQMADLEAGLPRPRDQLASQGDTVQLPEPVPDPQSGGISAVTPGLEDDLTRMRGIGKALQKQLNEIGINTFEQIAQWDKESIESFSSKLALKDRIRRDDWVGQARKLKV
ncbi:MAG: hypothetical protein VCA55_07325 [Verrucomicrobiales bacterium]